MKARILVVDSGEAIRSSVKSRLEREGHTVVTVEGYDAALSHLRLEEKIDVLITTVNFGGKDGFQLVQDFTKKNPNMKTIILSDHGKNDAVRAIRSGVFDYFEKPFSVDELSSSVRRCLATVQHVPQRHDTVHSVPQGQFPPVPPSGGGAALPKLQLVSSEGVSPELQTSLDANLSYTEIKKKWSDSFEREYLVAILNRNGGNVSAAARQTKLDRSNFLRLLRRHGLRAEQYRKIAA